MLDTLKIFLLPSEPVYTHINRLKLDLREEIGNYFYWDYEPHISLIYLKIEAGHEEVLTERVGQVVLETRPFDISLNKILAPGRGLVFVDVEKSIPLRTLTNDLHQTVKEHLLATKPQHQDFEKYLRHHITIGNYIKGDKYDVARKTLEKARIPESFDARRLVVYKEDPISRKNMLVSEFDLAAG